MINSSYLLFRDYRQQAQSSKCSGLFTIALWRHHRLVHLQQEQIDSAHSQTHLYLKVLTKTLLWIYGANRLTLQGDPELTQLVQSFFQKDGELAFEGNFFGELFDTSFSVEASPLVSSVAGESYSLTLSGRGRRVGLDLGGSSIKACYLEDELVLRTILHSWSPLDTKQIKNGQYVLEQICQVIDQVSAGGAIESLGISTSGVVIGGELYLSALYRYFEHPKECRQLVEALQTLYSCPINLINDGEAAALELAVEGGALAIVMGSDEGGGYLAPRYQSRDQINELAFVPVVLDDDAPIDSWSKHRGCGGVYLSVRGLEYFTNQGLDSHRSAKEIGKILAHALAYYSYFYQYEAAILLGGVTSDGRRVIMEESCKAEWQTIGYVNNNFQFIEPAEQFRFQQAVTAAKLSQGE